MTRYKEKDPDTKSQCPGCSGDGAYYPEPLIIDSQLFLDRELCCVCGGAGFINLSEQLFQVYNGRN